MLHRYCSQFLAYCQLADFSARSIQALTIRLIDFTADYNAPSIHVTMFMMSSLNSGALFTIQDATPFTHAFDGRMDKNADACRKMPRDIRGCNSHIGREQTRYGGFRSPDTGKSLA